MDMDEHEKQTSMSIDTQYESGDNLKGKLKKYILTLGLIGLAVLKYLKPMLVLLKASKFTVTIVSMLVTIGVYAMFFGWWFALGFVILIYIHENGHMYAAKKIGLPVSKPVFIPFMGAFIALKEMPKTAQDEAIIGIGGPAAGIFASLLCVAVYGSTGSSFWMALAYMGFFLNMFNLVPVGMLDGGRIASAISYWLWVPGIIILTYLAFKFHNPIIFLVIILGVMQAYKVFKERNNPEISNYYQTDSSFRLKMGICYLALLMISGAGAGITHTELQNYF